jgi:drug/metabolite transporter (DMT)-like permease
MEESPFFAYFSITCYDPPAMDNETLALVLILISALIHASWNVVLKSASDKFVVTVWLGIIGFVMALPGLYWVGLPNTTVLPWIFASLFIHVIYQFSLQKSYDLAPFSVVYPISRGTGPLVVALLGFLVVGDQMATIGLVGVGLISLGIFSMTRPEPNELQHPEKLLKHVMMAMGLGLLIGTYTLIDANGVRSGSTPFIFIVWSYIFYGIAYTTFAMMVRRDRLISDLRASAKIGITVGLLANTGYGLALLAFNYGVVGEIAALRELSIIFAVVIGFFFLSEKIGMRRIRAVVIISIGTIVLKCF